MPVSLRCLSGAPFDVKFISFEDIKNDPHLLDSLDVIINVGDADTAHTGGIWWEDPEISSAIRASSSGTAAVLSAWVSLPVTRIRATFSSLPACWSVEEENGFTLNYDKYNWEEHRIISSCRMLTNPSTSVRQEEHLCAGRHGSAGAAE